MVASSIDWPSRESVERPLYGVGGEIDKAPSLVPDDRALFGPYGTERRLSAVLAHLLIDRTTLMTARLAARRNGSSTEEELVAHGIVGEEELAEAFALVLDLPLEPVAPGITILRDGRGALGCGPRHLKGCGEGFEATLYLCPMLDRLDEVAGHLHALGPLRRVVRVTTRSEIARARGEATHGERSDRARLSLAADERHLSSREVMTPAQATGLTLLAVAVVLAWATLPQFWFVAHLLCSLCAFTLTLFRLAILAGMPAVRSREAMPALLPDGTGAGRSGERPFYSVLVALHREAAMAPEIVRAMAALDWPASRLEVLFVCEASDPETIGALEAEIAGRPNFSVIATPRGDPTTKPKALNFALPLARGEFLVLYDAEDRPDPGQLRAAHEAFRNAPETLACVQAPLTIRNARAGWLPSLFALEYEVLFKATLPWLAARSLPLPLGGTSNHFRREALLEVGGWDSHNVAEDADLGIRLARRGYRTGVIAGSTSESAPVRWPDWRNQRTRWIKGWMQTWLVHMRDPARLVREIGWRDFAAFQLVFGGMVASSLLHVVFGLHLMATAAAWLGGESGFLLFGLLTFFDVLNLLLAHLAFAALAARVARPDLRPFLPRLWSIWGYWFLVSLAGLRAAHQLLANPHAWEKTPHAPDTEAAYRSRPRPEAS